MRLVRSRPVFRAALAGLLLAATGAVMGTQPGSYVVPVSMSAAAYDVGGASLAARGEGVYSGPAGAVVVSRAAGITRAGGSTGLRGLPARGSCAIGQSETSERCEFHIGDRALSARDTRRPFGWERRYGDGGQVFILIRSGGAVPVPLPVGR